MAHRYCLTYDLDSIEINKIKEVCSKGLPNHLIDGENKRKKWHAMVKKTLKALAVSISPWFEILPVQIFSAFDRKRENKPTS